MWVGGGERKKVPEKIEGCEVGIRADQEKISPSVVPGPRETRVSQEAERQATEAFHVVRRERCEQRVGEVRVAQVQ